MYSHLDNNAGTSSPSISTGGHNPASDVPGSSIAQSVGAAAPQRSDAVIGPSSGEGGRMASTSTASREQSHVGHQSGSSAMTARQDNRMTAWGTWSEGRIRDATEGFHKDCCVGHGAFGRVYRGTCSEGKVAIKVLNVKTDWQQFDIEWKALEALRHDNIVKYVGRCTEPTAIVMEWLDGGNFEDSLRRSAETPPSWLARLQIMSDVAQGLRCLHARGYFHRDIKPGT